MKRGRQFGDTARAAGVTKPKGMDPRLDGEIDDDRATGRDGADLLREAVRETEPLGAFDARAIRVSLFTRSGRRRDEVACREHFQLHARRGDERSALPAASWAPRGPTVLTASQVTPLRRAWRE